MFSDRRDGSSTAPTANHLVSRRVAFTSSLQSTFTFPDLLNRYSETTDDDISGLAVCLRVERPTELHHKLLRRIVIAEALFAGNNFMNHEMAIFLRKISSLRSDVNGQRAIYMILKSPGISRSQKAHSPRHQSEPCRSNSPCSRVPKMEPSVRM